MTQQERRAAISLASIFALRMLGLFIILPIFSLYTDDLNNATPTLMGLALGIYGLTQALFQLPFGMLSDKFGRKPIIAVGLILFAVGSIIAACSSSIHGIILGRALQGAGAIGSTIMALLADLTAEENRTKAMAIIGLTIGIAFTSAIIIGPILNAWIKLSGIFWLTAILAMLGLGLLLVWVPTPKKIVFQRDAQPIPTLFKSLLKDKELLRLNFGIFTSHGILTANFVVIPILLEKILGVSETQQWILYLPVLILAFIAMLPMIIIAEKQQKMKSVFITAISLLTFTQFSLGMLQLSTILFVSLLFIFFTAFTFLEASLPSLVSKQAPVGSKGTALGIYSMAQFLGIFCGGTFGGWLYGHFPLSIVFLVCGSIAVVWLILAITMKQPRYLSTKTFAVGKLTATEVNTLTQKLLTIPGVAEALIIDHIAYLKVDNKQVKNEELTQIFLTT